jgi:hypothetical protein
MSYLLDQPTLLPNVETNGIEISFVLLPIRQLICFSSNRAVRCLSTA